MIEHFDVVKPDDGWKRPWARPRKTSTHHMYEYVRTMPSVVWT